MYAQKHAGRMSASRQSKDVLLSALTERDPELGGHLSVVAELAESTARHMGLARDEIETIRHAAELHDVGKVSIPDGILAKAGPLNDEEWAFVRRHTLAGERIIGAAPALTTVARLVRSSHERWDGSGYPDGLADDAIPLGARIVAVADAFDAMTAGRPYREGISHAEAIGELRRCAGTQFDPLVVDAFVVTWHATAVPDVAPARRTVTARG
jgi:response regulator RpfG family c-di-GMP phosphodiesterase